MEAKALKLRRDAEHCRRLANTIADERARSILQAMARDLHAQAEMMNEKAVKPAK